MGEGSAAGTVVLVHGGFVDGSGGRVYCLLSDGELQEGQAWEALMSAGHHGLDNLVVMVDNNHMQADGATADVMTVEPVPKKLDAFGFAARRLDANSIGEVLDAFAWAKEQRRRPTGLVCDTCLARAFRASRCTRKVHYIRAADEVWARALEELG
jgi:transketolase